ncbi:hypothetical protein DENSPDRAFT_846240 [Dentipellis sp. KUC8613]|nr:hypothetical protein DENSPDRAFT_846240 [Dentipellis sp. KUC8613]
MVAPLVRRLGACVGARTSLRALRAGAALPPSRPLPLPPSLCAGVVPPATCGHFHPSHIPLRPHRCVFAPRPQFLPPPALSASARHRSFIRRPPSSSCPRSRAH